MTLPLLVEVDPATLSIIHIFQGEEVVTGGPDGQTWVATFASATVAGDFIEWAQQRARRVIGYRRESE